MEVFTFLNVWRFNVEAFLLERSSRLFLDVDSFYYLPPSTSHLFFSRPVIKPLTPDTFSFSDIMLQDRDIRDHYALADLRHLSDANLSCNPLDQLTSIYPFLEYQ